MPTQDADLDDLLWPERDQQDNETRTVIALLSFIGGGLCDELALAKAAADDAGVPVPFAFSLLRRYTGPGSRSDHFWVARRLGADQLQYRLVYPA